MMAAFANRCWLLQSAMAVRRFRAALAHPQAAQDRLLAQWLRRHSTSSWGREHDFAGLDPVTFRARHPVTTWSDYSSWIGRIAAGEPAVLSCDPVRSFLPTSGSSEARKLIPAGPGLQRAFAEAVGCWMHAIANTHPQALVGRAYWSLSPPAFPTDRVGCMPVGFGDDGDYLGWLGAWLARSTFAVPPAIGRITDPTQWRDATCLHLLRCADLSLISVWSPSFLILLWQAICQDWGRLLEDAGWSAYRRRQRQLLGMDRPDPALIWPQLALISCWTHGSSQEGAAHLAALFPGVPLQPKGLVATEAIVSIPWQESHDPLLAVTAQVVEFEAEDGSLLGPETVEVGRTYGVVVSNGGGLWRYRLGDMVEITGHIANTPTLRFLGRDGGVSDLRGEKLHPVFVEHALRAACSRLGLTPTFLLLAPEDQKQGFVYCLYLESLQLILPAIIDALASDLDQRLADNPHYAHCRRLGQLAPLMVCPLHGPPGAASLVYQEVQRERGLRIGDIKSSLLATEVGWSVRFSSLITLPDAVLRTS